jgi:hypothetical protein
MSKTFLEPRGGGWASRCHALVVVAAGAIAATACTAFREDPPGDAGISNDAVGAGDGGLVEERPNVRATRPCDPSQPFGARTFVAGITNLMTTELGGLRLSPDGLTAYFHVSGRPDSAGRYDLYTATRPTLDAAFDHLEPIAGTGINTPSDEYDPTVSGDGLSLIFGRVLTDGKEHLQYARRPTRTARFTYVGPLPGVDIAAAPFLREDGRVLYFNAVVDGGSTTDIYRATWDGARFESPVPVTELDTEFDDEFPVVTRDDFTIYFASSRPHGSTQGSHDIWVARRASTTVPFSVPVNVGELNSPDRLRPSFVPFGACSIYFSSYSLGGLAAITAEYVAEKPAR